MLIVLFAVVSPVPAHAFLYRAPEGSLKDNCVIWHDGSFHLFTMYRKTQQLHDVIDDWRYVWHATSQDGVHWKDGSAVIHDAPFPIWAMRVWRAGGRFVMNHGSFTGGQQDVLRFWESPDLVHWTCLGPDYDVRRPARPCAGLRRTSPTGRSPSCRRRSMSRGGWWWKATCA